MVLTSDVRPGETLYYIGAYILDALKKNEGLVPLHVEELFGRVRDLHGVESDSFNLGMDWLFLLGIVDIDQNGRVVRCS